MSVEATPPAEVEETEAPAARAGGGGLFELARHYATVLAGIGATRGLTFVASAILARELTVSGFGEYSLAYTILVLAWQLPLMLDASFVRHVAAAPTDADRAGYLRAHLRIKTIASIATVVIGVAISPLLVHQVFGAGGSAALISAAIVGGAALSAINTILAYLQAQRRFFLYSVMRFAINLVAFVALVVYVALWRATALGAMLVFNTVVYSIGAVAVTAYLAVRARAGGLGPIGDHTRQLVRFSGWLIPASIAYLFVQRIDLLLLARFGTTRLLGLYGSAVTISSVFSLFTANLSTVFLPRASQTMAAGRDLGRYFLQATLAVLGILALIGAGILWTRPLIRFTLGRGYLEATTALRLLLVAYALVSIESPLASIHYGAGATGRLFVQRLLELGTAATFGVLLIPDHSLTGAGLSIVLGYAAGALFLAASSAQLVRRRRDEAVHVEAPR